MMHRMLRLTRYREDDTKTNWNNNLEINNYFPGSLEWNDVEIIRARGMTQKLKETNLKYAFNGHRNIVIHMYI